MCCGTEKSDRSRLPNGLRYLWRSSERSISPKPVRSFRGGAVLDPRAVILGVLRGVCTHSRTISIVLQRYVRLSATLLGIMLFLFVLQIHLPNLAADPKNRIVWALVLRDIAFSGGEFALAAQGRKWMVNLGRIAIAIPSWSSP